MRVPLSLSIQERELFPDCTLVSKHCSRYKCLDPFRIRAEFLSRTIPGKPLWAKSRTCITASPATLSEAGDCTESQCRDIRVKLLRCWRDMVVYGSMG